MPKFYVVTTEQITCGYTVEAADEKEARQIVKKHFDAGAHDPQDARLTETYVGKIRTDEQISYVETDDDCQEGPPDPETILTDCYYCGSTFDTGETSVADVFPKPYCGCGMMPTEVSHAAMLTGN